MRPHASRSQEFGRLIAAALAVLSVLIAGYIVLEVVASGGSYGCIGPAAFVLVWPLGLFSVLAWALARAAGSAVTGKVALMALVVGVAAGGYSMTRPYGYRGTPRSEMIGNIRTVISAQATYEYASGGGYAPMMICLTQPRQCLRSYDGPVFLGPDFEEAVRGSYRREFQAGFDGSKPVPPGSAGAFAYLGIPLDPTSQGVCGDSRGNIYTTPAGTAPRAKKGRCVGGDLLR